MSTTTMKTTCPNCGTEIKLEDQIAAPLIAEKTKEFAAKEKQFQERMQELTKQEAAKEIEFAKQLEAQKQKIEAEALKAATQAATEKAKAEIALEMDAKSKELETAKKLMAEREEKLKIAQEREALYLEKERLLEDKERELNLTVQKQVSAAKEEMFKKAQAELSETQALKLKEKDEQLSSMQKKSTTCSAAPAKVLNNCKARFSSSTWKNSSLPNSHTMTLSQLAKVSQVLTSNNLS